MIEEYKTFVREKMHLNLDWDGVPRYMRDGIAAHVMQGRRTGDFLYNLFTNDLQGVVGHADETNIHLLKDYVHFMYKFFPVGSYGSPEAVASWRKSGGILGQAAASVPEKSVTEMLQALPVVGTLNVDTNEFTPAPGHENDDA